MNVPVTVIACSKSAPPSAKKSSPIKIIRNNVHKYTDRQTHAQFNLKVYRNCHDIVTTYFNGSRNRK